MPEVQLRLDSEVALTDSLRRAVWRPKGHRAPIPPNAQQWAPPLPLRRRGSVTTKNPAASVLVDTAGQMSFLLPFLRPPDARGAPGGRLPSINCSSNARDTLQSHGLNKPVLQGLSRLLHHICITYVSIDAMVFPSTASFPAANVCQSYHTLPRRCNSISVRVSAFVRSGETHPPRRIDTSPHPLAISCPDKSFNLPYAYPHPLRRILMPQLAHPLETRTASRMAGTKSVGQLI